MFPVVAIIKYKYCNNDLILCVVSLNRIFLLWHHAKEEQKSNSDREPRVCIRVYLPLLIPA
jgi:hypothetical protein